jgi:hypothetical protein
LNSDLKEVIRRLDSELQRQQSHNALKLFEQDELRLRIETDRFFKGQDDENESDFGKKKRRQARSQSGNRDKGGALPPQTQEQSPLSIMQQKKIDELEEQIR